MLQRPRRPDQHAEDAHARPYGPRTSPAPAIMRAPWLMRARLDARAKRNARHPVNAMLNAVFALTAGRLAAYIVAAGLSPAIGFLHGGKRGRWSLAWMR